MPARDADIPIADQLASIAEPIRLRMLRVLEQHELTVGEMASVVQLPQSTASRHLKALASADWITKRAERTSTFYSASADDMPEQLAGVWQSVRASLDPADPTLSADDRRAAAALDERKTDSKSYFGRVAGEWDHVRSNLFGEQFTALGLLALLPPDCTIADFGSGTGNVPDLLAPWASRVIAIDQSDAMLDAASKRLSDRPNVKLVRAESHATPLEAGEVDVAVAVLLLQYLAHPAETLAEMRRVTRPGGKVLIIDMHEHRDAALRRAMGHRHLGFSDQAVEALFRDAGLPAPSTRSLPLPTHAEGPGLFAAVATVGAADENLDRNSSRRTRSRRNQSDHVTTPQAAASPSSQQEILP